MKTRLLKMLLWIAALGPTAFLVADKVAHMFGLCLGM